MSSLGFGLDGTTSVDATVDPTSGAELRFGSYRITVSLDADGSILLLVRQVDDSDSKGNLEEKLGFSLTGVLPGKRRLSWILAGVVVLLFLLIPVGSYVTSGATGHRFGDSSWSSGKLSLNVLARGVAALFGPPLLDKLAAARTAEEVLSLIRDAESPK